MLRQLCGMPALPPPIEKPDISSSNMEFLRLELERLATEKVGGRVLAAGHSWGPAWAVMLPASSSCHTPERVQQLQSRVHTLRSLQLPGSHARRTSRLCSQHACRPMHQAPPSYHT